MKALYQRQLKEEIGTSCNNRKDRRLEGKKTTKTDVSGGDGGSDEHNPDQHLKAGVH